MDDLNYTNKKKTILIIFTLALIVRSIYFVELSKPIGAMPGYSKIIIKEVGMQRDIGLRWPRMLGADSSFYDGTAMNILKTKHYPGVYWPPLFSYFLAVLYMFFGQSSTVIRFIFGILSSITCVLIYLIGCKAFNEEAGLASAIIAVFHPSLVIFSAFYLTETLFLPLIMTFFLFFLYSLEKPSIFNLVISGVSLGLASLCRGIALGFTPFILLALSWKFAGDHKKTIRIFVIIVTALCLTIAPWTIRNYLVTGSFVPVATHGGIAFYIGNNPEATGSYYWPRHISEQFNGFSEVEQERKAYALGIKHIIYNPSAFARMSIHKFYLFWIHKFPNGRIGYLDDHRFNIRFLTILGIIGAGLSLSNWRKISILYLFLPYITVIHMLFFVLPRFRMPVVPILIIFSGYTITHTIGQIWKKGKFFQTNLY